MRADLDIVSGLVPRGSRVLDLGCGDGALLEHLIHDHGCHGYGVEISHEGVHACIARGVPVVEADIDAGLADVDDDSFDVVILSQTLQATHRPTVVIDEMMRVGREGIVSFPNFAHWPLRVQLAVRGRMPKSRLLPYEWYDTPNIHLCTVGDFEDLVRHRGLRVARRIVLGPDGRQASPRAERRANLLAAGVVYVLHRARDEG
ncbi:MAG: methionine biosynthesis protein MetW [Actinomycetota bacterium]